MHAHCSNRKIERRVALTVSIFDHYVNNVSCFKYLGILVSSDFTWTDHVDHIILQRNLAKGLVCLGVLSIIAV